MIYGTEQHHKMRAPTPVFTIYTTLLQSTKNRRWQRPFAAKCNSEIFLDIRHENTNIYINTPLLQHRPRHLCYDGVVYAYGGRVPGREDRGWTLSRSWIR